MEGSEVSGLQRKVSGKSVSGTFSSAENASLRPDRKRESKREREDKIACLLACLISFQKKWKDAILFSLVWVRTLKIYSQ